MEHGLRTELTLLNMFVGICETTKEQEGLVHMDMSVTPLTLNNLDGECYLV